MKSAVVYGPDGAITGVRHAWTFDDMYSAFATQGLEQKKKGEFTPQELQPLAKVNVESLKEYDFFTYAKANGKDVTFVDPVEYSLEFDPKETVLTLHFILPLKAPLKAKALSLEVFDPRLFRRLRLGREGRGEPGKAPAVARSGGKPQEMTKEMAQKLAEIRRTAKFGQQLRGGVLQQDFRQMSLTRVTAERSALALMLFAAAASILLAAGAPDVAFAQGAPFGAPRNAPTPRRRHHRLDVRQAGRVLP
jgi:hypothetical protein